MGRKPKQTAVPDDLARRYRVDDGRGFRLADHDPGDTAGLTSPEDARAALEHGIADLRELQELLWAQDRWAVLLIFQALDAAGKDGTIKHVMSGVNPQGCQVFSFKAPSEEELDHDFLWRTSRRLPERGRIGIFNRSYYEEVLVVRVHGELLERQRLPRKLVRKSLWKDRFEDIAAFERYLGHNGIVVRKFFLNVSKKEQEERLRRRLEDSKRHWKFSLRDVEERAYWKHYQKAYEDTVRATSTKHAPWYVIPADNKWFTRLVVSQAIVATLESLDLHFPAVGPEKRRELRRARKLLDGE